MQVVLLFVVASFGVLALAVALRHRRNQRAHAHLVAHTVEIYGFLSATSGPEGLCGVVPRGRWQLWRAGRVLATLAGCFVECRAERVRVLSQAWGVEQMLLRTIGHPISSRRAAEAMELLLGLHPSLQAAGRVEECRFRTARAALARLLVVLYAKPSQVAPLLKMHPHRLSWQQMGRVVEVLKMRNSVLEMPRWDGVSCYNLQLLELYMAQVEGVGDAPAVASRLSEEPDMSLRRAATNTLWSVRRFPRFGGSPRGPRG